MILSLSQATEIGIQAYHEFGYSEGPISILKMTSRRLQEHLEQNHLPYTFLEVQTWVKAIPERSSTSYWIQKRAIAMEKAVRVLDEIICYGKPISTMTPLLERIPADKRISKHSFTVMQNYLKSASECFSKTSIRVIKDAIARFLLIMEQNDSISNVSDISNSLISNYFLTDTHVSESATKIYRHYVEDFLLFCVNNGLLPEETLCTFRHYSSPLSPLLSLIDTDTAENFIVISACDNEVSYDISEYLEGSRSLLSHLQENHYGIEYFRTIRRGLHTFEVFLRINELRCSKKLATLWFAYLETVCNHIIHNNIRRAVLSALEILVQGTLNTRTFSSCGPKYYILQWQEELLDAYKIYRSRMPCAPSTWRTIYAACSHFFVFMNQQGVEKLSDLTPRFLKQFHLEDNHSSAKGKNLYTSQLRLFLEYLVSRNSLPAYLPLALSCHCAPCTKVVSVLSEDETEAVYNYRDAASTSMELRDCAVFLLGLRMGFRGADIINLSFQNISWKEQTISITQQKTGVFLKQPMPADVGNSLYRYIQNGRPKQAHCEYIFVRHTAPYCELSRGSSIGKRLEKVLVNQQTGVSPKGFHITRRTFASSLLKSGSTVPIIAAALGHADFSNVDKYLSIDSENLRKCAIGLQCIEYIGGFGL